MKSVESGNCLVVEMVCSPEPSLVLLERVGNAMRNAGFDVQGGRIKDQIILVGLGRALGVLFEIRNILNPPGGKKLGRMQYGKLSLLGAENFLEFQIFMAQEDDRRTRAKKEPKRVLA